MSELALSRRNMVFGLTSTAGLALVGCGPRGKSDDAARGSTHLTQEAGGVAVTAAMTVYRDPSCGCCEAWAGIARKAGYQVTLLDHNDMPAIKRQHGVPDELASCHTTIVGGYTVEGHVPLEDVQRLLIEKPAGVRGIAVAGMPTGSPGMEVADGTTQPFDVNSFDGAGRISIFRSSSALAITNVERDV